MTCEHYNDGVCNLMNGKTVSPGVCRACLENTAPGEWPPATNILQRARVGTRIKSATSAIGIKPCGGCNKRAQIFNGDKLQS